MLERLFSVRHSSRLFHIPFLRLHFQFVLAKDGVWQYKDHVYFFSLHTRGAPASTGAKRVWSFILGPLCVIWGHRRKPTTEEALAYFEPQVEQLNQGTNV